MENLENEKVTDDVAEKHNEINYEQLEKLENIIKSLELKIDSQEKIINESNNKFKNFVDNYMNIKHNEIKKEAEKVIDDNDKSYEF